MATGSLRAAREALGWSQDHVVRLLIVRAQAAGTPPAKPSSLKTALSRWENEHIIPDAANRRLLREVYGLDNDELGYPPENDPDDIAAELRERLLVASSVDAETVDLFYQQTDTARATDRKFGAAAMLEKVRVDIDHMTDLLSHAVMTGQRERLAAALTGASTLAGWAALDAGGLRQAWRHYDAAKAAARESGSPLMLTHALAEQASLLIEVGESASAVELLTELNGHAHDETPALFRSWLAAALGEAHAADGRADDARRMFDRAHDLLPTQRRDPDLPFIFLDPTNLDRWRGNALARLGDPAAIDTITGALQRPLSARAHARMLVDLAYAHAAAGNRTAAMQHAREARRLASRIGSALQLGRLRRLVLPVDSA